MHSIIVFDDSAPLTYYAVVFRIEPEEAELRLLAERLLDAKPLYRLKGNYRLYFEDLREKTGAGRESLVRSAAHQFISLLYLLTEAGREMHYSDSRNAHIEKALRILQASIFSRISLEDLSGRVGLDKSYFIRLFKAKMGTTPMKYLKRLKLEAARSLLMSTGESLAAIAAKLAFYSEFHFSKSFKAYTGVSPSGFREGRGGEASGSTGPPGMNSSYQRTLDPYRGGGYTYGKKERD
jgi:AraC-like DNA-binding protein